MSSQQEQLEAILEKFEMEAFFAQKHSNIRVKEAVEAITALIQEARIDERKRVSYEHEQFTKELFKDNVLDVKKWWFEIVVDSYERRCNELKQM